MRLSPALFGKFRNGPGPAPRFLPLLPLALFRLDKFNAMIAVRAHFFGYQYTCHHLLAFVCTAVCLGEKGGVPLLFIRVVHFVPLCVGAYSKLTGIFFFFFFLRVRLFPCIGSYRRTALKNADAVHLFVSRPTGAHPRAVHARRSAIIVA